MGNSLHAQMCLVDYKPIQPISLIHYLSFGIGSIRGLAFVSAYEELLNNPNVKLDLKGCSGCSVGSVICLLLLLKYTPKEMNELVPRLFQGINGTLFQLSYSCGLVSVLTFDYFHQFFMTLMKERNIPTNITFNDIDLDMRVVAYDKIRKQPFIFSKTTTPNATVLQAVLASCAIPFIFPPIQIDNICYVDGGVAIEIPFFEFPTEHSLGFYLYDKYRARTVSFKFFSTLTPFEKDHIISIDVSRVNFADFQLTERAQTYLYNKGKTAVQNYYTQKDTSIKFNKKKFVLPNLAYLAK